MLTNFPDGAGGEGNGTGEERLIRSSLGFVVVGREVFAVDIGLSKKLTLPKLQNQFET